MEQIFVLQVLYKQYFRAISMVRVKGFERWWWYFPITTHVLKDTYVYIHVFLFVVHTNNSVLFTTYQEFISVQHDAGRSAVHT